MKIINLSFSFISNLKKDLNKITTNNKKNEEIKNSIMLKLKDLEDVLTKYKNYLNRTIGKDKIHTINYPIITLSNEEKNCIKENTENKHRTITKTKIENKEDIDMDLQMVIDFLFNLKEISIIKFSILMMKVKFNIICFPKIIQHFLK